ncbi:glycosyltransferase family 2 protein [Sulfurimonas sp. C5]|uniref:glycosyltransferase family 2 protein n=1 Tax=Sulfurimonas sp. C5 TaxID=3036947 RepID=UPI0024558B82|nr:glycosyltransferase family 2 protein [Sulfurimonas sp. C5]MDH4944067.1 glycosyltransferase family 2 protein [Sulfurimonas sp. C5]
MKSDVKISIITVVYNGATYLEKTIQSILNQTYDNLEYIIIDGGSIDGTIDIIKKYEDKISYWISEKDAGIYDAMNKGIDISSGDYINFLNAGDSFADYYVLERIFNNQEMLLYDLVYGPAIVTGGKKEVLLHPKKFTKFNLYLWNTRVVCHQAIFIKREEIVKYTLKYKLKGELNWYLDLVEKVDKVLIVDFPIVYYSLGGTGDMNYKLNTIESIKVVYGRNKLFASLSLPVIIYKYFKKVLNK